MLNDEPLEFRLGDVPKKPKSTDLHQKYFTLSSECSDFQDLQWSVQSTVVRASSLAILVL